jgi:hypothetical protein
MTNRLTQLIAEMEQDDDRKIETLAGVVAIGGYLRDLARDEDCRKPEVDVTARRVVADALRYMLGREPTAEEVAAVMSGGI